MSEENAPRSPAGYLEIPRKARPGLMLEAVSITVIVVGVICCLIAAGIIIAVTWPWGGLVTFGVLSIFGAVVFVLLHQREHG